MARPQAPAVGLKVKAAMASAEINTELVCPLRIPSCSHQPPFPEWWDNLSPHVQKTAWQQLCWWGYSHHSGTGLLQTYGPSSTWCNSLLWLNVLLAGSRGWRHWNPFIWHIMNLLWLLSDKGTHVCFCWIPSHRGIEGNERVDQLAKETLDHDIDPLSNFHFADLKPLVNSYISSSWFKSIGMWLYMAEISIS